MSPRYFFMTLTILAMVLAFTSLWKWAMQKAPQPLTDPAMALQEKSNALVQYVGGKICANCHNQEYERWTGSHHDLALQEAKERTVLGNFGDTSFTNFGVLESLPPFRNERESSLFGRMGLMANYRTIKSRTRLESHRSNSISLSFPEVAIRP